MQINECYKEMMRIVPRFGATKSSETDFEQVQQDFYKNIAKDDKKSINGNLRESWNLKAQSVKKKPT